MQIKILIFIWDNCYKTNAALSIIYNKEIKDQLLKGWYAVADVIFSLDNLFHYQLRSNFVIALLITRRVLLLKLCSQRKTSRKTTHSDFIFQRGIQLFHNISCNVTTNSHEEEIKGSSDTYLNFVLFCNISK
jgi:hypothetical protein